MSLAPYVGLCEGPETVRLDFRFQCQAPGANDPDFQFPAGAVLDVVRASAGLYNITLKNKWPQLICATGCVQAAAVGATGMFVQVVSYTASTGVLVVRTVDPDTAGLPTAADPADNDWVHIQAAFCRRTALMAVGAV